MEIQIEHLENHTARLTVAVDPDRADKAMRRAAQQIARKGRIPGFRPGKAPYNIVLSMYGHENVLSQALETLGNEVYREALDEAKIDPYAPGSLEDINEDDGLTLTFTVPKQPTVDLGDYRNIRIPYEVAEAADDEVNEALENMRQDQALVEPVQRPARMGDQLKFAYFEVVVLDEDEDKDEKDETGTATDTDDDGDGDGDDWDDDENGDEDEKEHVLIRRFNLERVLREDENDLFPGFSPELVGLSAEDEKTFTLVLPDDFDMEEIAGQTLCCEVHVETVQSRTVPEWTDALAAQISEGEFETLLELRMDVRKQLQEEFKRAADAEVANKMMEQLVEQSTIHYPEELVQDYIDTILDELDDRLQQQGLSVEQYLNITGREAAAFREEQRDNAITRAKRSLTLLEFVRGEGLVIDETDINAEIDQMIGNVGGERSEQFRQFLMMDRNREDIANRLMTNRMMERLAAIGKGENPPTGPAVAADESADTSSESVPETGTNISGAAEAEPEPPTDEKSEPEPDSV